jgi:pSer/pThr/pTyr-binding forkhead associated (FHA) protein/tetratricopeptide (TPR) repeat protein
MHKLLIEDDEGKTVAVPLIREEISIGRMDGNTIRLTEQNVSRKHARLTLRSGTLRIEDLGSYNGTSLNGSALSGVATLKDGDVILIGDYRLGIQEDRQAVHAAPESAPVMPSPAVEEVMEGQPTIPLSTLTAHTAFSEPPARLLVTGRFQSGAEFILERVSQVIGRTPENDIVLNHKSISRHHAKILRDGNRYTILDLESANGVRVGGVERDKAELKSGDVLELGEVRLRFLSGDADLDDEPRVWYQNKGKLGLAAGLGAAAVAGALIFVFAGGPSIANQPAVVAVTPPAPVTPPPAVQPSPTPVPAENAKPAEPMVPLADLLAQAKASAQQEKWEEALALVDKGTAQSPDSSEAAELRKAILTEQKHGERMAALKAALADKEFDTVVQGTSEIPDDSMYRARAVDLRKAALPQAIALHLESATNKLVANACDGAKQEAQAVLALDAKNKKAASVIKRCDVLAAAPPPVVAAHPVVAAVPEPKPVARKVAVAAGRPAPTAKPRSAEPARPADLAGPAADPDKLIKDAQQAWFRGQYSAAIASARQALRIRPGLTNAYQIIAVCSCALHDAESAARAFEKLDDRNKQYVKSACQKNGIAF